MDIKVYYNLKNLIRYNQRVRLKDESVAEHSYYVALYTELICKELKMDMKSRLMAIQYALLHDIPEIYTSDIPHPIKQKSDALKKSLKVLEREMLKEQLPEYLPLIEHVEEYDTLGLIHLIVETADVMSVIQYAKQEIELGNQTMQPIFDDGLLRYRKLHKAIYEITQTHLMIRF